MIEYVYAKSEKYQTLKNFGFDNPVKYRERKMEIEVKKSVKVEDGEHTGVIKRVEYRTEPYPYTDVCVSVKGVEDEEFSLKYGCPTNASEDSKLMNLLKEFKKDIKIGSKIDIDAILVGTPVKYMTIKKKAKDGKEYTNIVEGSLKPFVK